MKSLLYLSVLACICLTAPLRAQFVVPGDGSDGALNITQDTVVDLSQAVTGSWDQNNTANAGKGVYDPEKWVVVFKYSSVIVAGHTEGNPPKLEGSKLSFKNHPSHAPVVWLVQGDVSVNGIVDLDGKLGALAGSFEAAIPAEPGPGGFRGGAQSFIGYGAGLGVGGGNPSVGGRFADSYGNPQILPLIGGSGSSGHDRADFSGSGGGGAILIAAQGHVNINGLISANGADRNAPPWNIFGAGGAIKIIAPQVGGTGSLTAVSNGRTRIETTILADTLSILPNTVAVPLGNTPPILWAPDNAPKVRIVSVDAIPAPVDPHAPLRTSADIGIQNSGEVDILLEAVNFPIEGSVQVRVSPKFGQYAWKTATRTGGDFTASQWRVKTTLPTGFTTLQARAVSP